MAKNKNSNAHLPFIILFCITVIFTISCGQEREENVLASTLEPTLREMYSGDLKNAVFHVSDQFLDSALFYSNLREVMAMSEYRDISDDLRNAYTSIRLPAKLDFISDSNMKYLFGLDIVFDSNRDYTGVIVLSQPAFINEDLAYFYLGLYCKSDCYSDRELSNIGVLVKVKRVGVTWGLEEIIPLWGG
jgi:hypothetical protein